jgi:hypothetical protein
MQVVSIYTSNSMGVAGCIHLHLQYSVDLQGASLSTALNIQYVFVFVHGT